MAIVLKLIEDVVTDPNTFEILFRLFGLNADIFYPKEKEATGNIIKRTSLRETEYDLENPDGEVEFVSSIMYEMLSHKSAIHSPLPEAEYEWYLRFAPDNMPIGTLAKIKLPYSSRERHLYWKLKRPDRLEGITKVLIYKWIMVPYNV